MAERILQEWKIDNKSSYKKVELSDGGFLFFFQRTDLGEGMKTDSFLLSPDEVKDLREFLKENE